MVNRSARKKVERILQRLQERKREKRTVTADEAEDWKIAWWTVWFAGFQEDVKPYEAALRKVLGPNFKQFAVRPPPPARHPKDDEALSEMDGRTGYQWAESIMEYLRWRSGRSWRRWGQRSEGQGRCYADAIWWVNMAVHGAFPSRPLPRPVPLVERPPVVLRELPSPRIRKAS